MHNPRNQLYQEEMFNEEIKNQFLNKFPDTTRKTYKRLFIRSFTHEERLNKDLSNFNLDEIADILYDMYPLTVTASRTNFTTVNSYIEWAIKKGYRENNLNPLKIAPNGWVKQFVDKSVLLYISKAMLDEITNSDPDGDGCKNAQDAVIFQLMFEGLDTHEICNLKKSDINGKKLRLVNKNGEVKENFEVSDRCVELIWAAYDQKEYLKKNGLDERSQGTTIQLVDSEYIIRAGRTNKTEGKEEEEAPSPHVVRRRLSVMSELFDNPYLTAKNIYRSGLIYEGYNIWDRDGRVTDKDGCLSPEQYKEICEKFRMSKVNNGGYMVYNTNPLKEYINLENFKRLYPDSE